jgi:hypothetical protein
MVQRPVGHTDPAITTEIYGHLEVEDARAHLEGLSLSPLPAEAGCSSRTCGPSAEESRSLGRLGMGVADARHRLLQGGLVEGEG